MNAPTPWSAEECHAGDWSIVDAQGCLIDSTWGKFGGVFKKDVAEHIVKCVNDDARATVVGKRVMNDGPTLCKSPANDPDV